VYKSDLIDESSLGVRVCSGRPKTGFLKKARPFQMNGFAENAEGIFSDQSGWGGMRQSGVWLAGVKSKGAGAPFQCRRNASGVASLGISGIHQHGDNGQISHADCSNPGCDFQIGGFGFVFRKIGHDSSPLRIGVGDFSVIDDHRHHWEVGNRNSGNPYSDLAITRFRGVSKWVVHGVFL